MTPTAIFTTIIVAVLLVALMKELMRPGLILFSGAVVFLCAGIINPKELLEGFSNKGMITVALLFLVSEGVRRSGLLEQLLSRLLPKGQSTIRGVQARMMPVVAALSAFLNNTPMVVIFGPMIKRWADRHKQPATKLLIPLSYATILGGMCTLIGTSTNLVVHGMALEEATRNPAVRGLSMFELGQVGAFIAIAGLLYIYIASKWLLPEKRRSESSTQTTQPENSRYYRVDVVLGARFPAIGKKILDFNFQQKYGATVLELHRGGETYIVHDLRSERYMEGDALVLLADDDFMENWGDSSFFMMVDSSKPQKEKDLGSKKRWFTVVLLFLMIFGAAVGELPDMRTWAETHFGMKFDMFFWVCVVTVIMAWLNIFNARKYTKFFSWDVLITIAMAFAISKAMQNSGMADAIAAWTVDLSRGGDPHLLLAVIFILASIFTELMTNNAAAALVFPISLSVAEHLGVSPMPFIVVICIAASCSFCTPIGYQTNLIVQGLGGYKFGDFIKVGLPLTLICLVLSVWLVPIFWPF